jgi:hypothetical protein
VEAPVNIVYGDQTYNAPAGESVSLMPCSVLPSSDPLVFLVVQSPPSSVPLHPIKTLPRLTRMFTGRRDILEQMSQWLNQTETSISIRKQRIVVLYGLGGGGKTQIVLKFVDEFGDQYASFLPNRH